MAGRGLARLGGVCGLLYVILMVPAYVAGYPDAPTPTSADVDVIAYFGASPGTFVLANGVLAARRTPSPPSRRWRSLLGCTTSARLARR